MGLYAAGKAGGFVEGTMSYTGDVADPSKGKYTLEYYLKLAQQLVDEGVHSLAIKDMAGLLTPRAATMLVSALREQHSHSPIHVHIPHTASGVVASRLLTHSALSALSGA